MNNYKKCAMALLVCSILFFSSCANGGNTDLDKGVMIESDAVVTEDNSTGENAEQDNKDENESDNPVEIKQFEGFYNCVEKENNFVRVDFEIKQKENDYAALFYLQSTPDDIYDYSEVFYGEEVKYNTYEFTCDEMKYIVTWDGEDQITIEGEDLGGTYVRGSREDEGEYPVKEVPNYETDKNVENGIELDSTLANAIRAELGLPSDHILTYADLESVTYLATWDYEIVSVKGISYLKNLDEIHFGTNYISDISEMTQLPNIRVIDLSQGYIKEIPDFSKCDKLNSMSLSGNMIEDVSPIAKIPNLEFLDLNDNYITSMAPLKESKKLEWLNIYGNFILDYSEVADCSFLVEAYNKGAQSSFDDALALEKKAEEIVASFPQDLSEIQLEKTIYQYIIDNMHYSNQTRNTNAFGYYGIMEGFGVCGDYAEAFALLARHAGLEAYVCSSDTHGWNIVKIDEKYYHCDALWDDGEGMIRWEHFNKSTAYISSLPHHTHDLLKYPICEESMSWIEYFDY